MTIRRNIDATVSSTQLGHLEDCAIEAPAGAYEDAKEIAEFFSDLFAYMRSELKRRNVYGVVLPNGDTYREVESVLYGAIKDASPDATVFAVAEGFGKAMNMGPETRARVLANTENNLAFLRSVGVIQ